MEAVEPLLTYRFRLNVKLSCMFNGQVPQIHQCIVYEYCTVFPSICILRSGNKVCTNIPKCIHLEHFTSVSILFNLIRFTVLFCSLLLNSSLKQSGNITADSFRKSFLQWEAVRFEVDKLCQEDHFDCPACSPDMLAVSVDGNRKHYRFKSAARYCVCIDGPLL